MSGFAVKRVELGDELGELSLGRRSAALWASRCSAFPATFAAFATAFSAATLGFHHHIRLSLGIRPLWAAVGVFFPAITHVLSEDDAPRHAEPQTDDPNHDGHGDSLAPFRRLRGR